MKEDEEDGGNCAWCKTCPTVDPPPPPPLLLLLRLLLLEWHLPMPRVVGEAAPAAPAAVPVALVAFGALLNQGTRPLAVAAARHSGCSSAAVRILGPVRRRWE